MLSMRHRRLWQQVFFLTLIGYWLDVLFFLQCLTFQSLPLRRLFRPQISGEDRHGARIQYTKGVSSRWKLWERRRRSATLYIHGLGGSVTLLSRCRVIGFVSTARVNNLVDTIANRRWYRHMNAISIGSVTSVTGPMKRMLFIYDLVKQYTGSQSLDTASIKFRVTVRGFHQL